MYSTHRVVPFGAALDGFRVLQNNFGFAVVPVVSRCRKRRLGSSRAIPAQYAEAGDSLGRLVPSIVGLSSECTLFLVNTRLCTMNVDYPSLTVGH